LKRRAEIETRWDMVSFLSSIRVIAIDKLLC
jgi:hypothetical protein